jgi:hypothetical protein
MNDMVLFQTGAAIAEAMAIGAETGVDEALLLQAPSNGSADSFALRNHAMKAMLPRKFPRQAFSTDYTLKDIDDALALAGQTGVEPRGAELVRDTLQRCGPGRGLFPRPAAIGRG